MRTYFSTGSARSAKSAEGSAGGAAAGKIGWLRRALPGSPFTPGRKRSGVFFAFGRGNVVPYFFRSRSQRFLAGFVWCLYLPFAKMQRREGSVRPSRQTPLPHGFQKETQMQKSRRLFFAFAAATALGATTLLTGCHHWHHRPPPPGGGRPGGGPGGPGGSGGPGGPGRPGPGPGGRPGPGFGPRPR